MSDPAWLEAMHACSPPVWANLMLADSERRMVSCESTAFHGLPRVGDRIDTLDGTYKVVAVTWAMTTTKTWKATVHGREVAIAS